MDCASSEPSDRAALDLEVLFRLHADELFAYAARRVGREVASEVTATTFRIAMEREPSFDSSLGEPRPWLYGIASNVIRSHRRTESRHLRALAREARRWESVSDGQAEVVDRVDAQRVLVGVLVELAALPAEDRDVMTLFAWEGLSYNDIAAALGIPVGTVRSRLHRVRRIIQLQRGPTT